MSREGHEGREDTKMDGIRRSVTGHGLRTEDIGDMDLWRNLVLGEGKPLYGSQSLGE